MLTLYPALALLGIFVGAFGTLIGAGGGFLLTPILLLLYPHESPAIITSISLAVVFFNSAAGSISYARMKRIDYRSGLLFSAAAVPGAILGAMTTSVLSRRSFDLLFGALILVVAITMLFRAGRIVEQRKRAGKNLVAREIVDASGTRYAYAYPRGLSLLISFGAGFLSSLLGIGGGIIHVPAMIHLLDFPVHVATATSHFVLVGMSFSGTLVHIVTGAFNRGIRRTAALAVGVLIGAPIGARLSNRVGTVLIQRAMAVALLAVGVRILWLALLLPNPPP